MSSTQAIDYNQYNQRILTQPYVSSMGGNTYQYESSGIISGGKRKRKRSSKKSRRGSSKRRTKRSKTCGCKKWRLIFG